LLKCITFDTILSHFALNINILIKSEALYQLSYGRPKQVTL